VRTTKKSARFETWVDAAADPANTLVMDMRFKEIDHSGDVGILAFGRDEVELLENATYGLFSLMVHGGVSGKVKRELTAEAENNGDLLVNWLSEVIATASVHGEVYGEVEITQAGPHSVRGTVGGEPVDINRHELRFDVKAATYHELEFTRTEGGYRARVIFDL
jgi:SHS2 domain-containing protein